VANIVITGFSGTGKSLVAREVAQRLNWNFIDTDEEIVELASKSIAEIFQQDGESGFRELERGIIKNVCQRKQTVVAVGGGAVVDPQNYELLAKSGAIVCLEAKPEVIYHRLFKSSVYRVENEVRPLLAGDNPLEHIRQLKSSRQPYYANADWTVHTDNLSIADVAGEVIRAWSLLRRFASHNEVDKDIACRVETATHNYPVLVGYGLLDRLGEKIKDLGLSGVVTLISDETVFSIYGGKVQDILKRAGFVVNFIVLPPGEGTKNAHSLLKIYDFLVDHRAERGDIIVALGGGMIGDLAGFAAATFLRGIPWVQVPTSLVAMVDASIGGKVGIDHPQGKNLIGAFYQPSFVLADVQTLDSLPQRELTSGWAEVIKYGLILDKEFLEFLKINREKLVKLEPGVIAQAIARSAAIKAQVVSEDERERGKRILLNYGHTIAHGLETATGYSRFLHGEAVAIGMMGAAKLSHRLELLSSDGVSQQQSLLQEFDLPVSFSKVDSDEITKAMELDKKTREKAIRWVLLEDIGKAVIQNNVSQRDLLAVLQELIEP